MTSTTIKNLPEAVYKGLKKQAAIHHRSLNSEIIHRLEQSLQQKEPEQLKVREDEVAYHAAQNDFIKSYQAEHHYKSHGEVIRDALYLLQQQQLEASYKEANAEINADLDTTSGDGLDDETW